MKDAVTPICYGQRQEWKNRDEAMKFFMQGVLECDGSERERYETILTKLMLGMRECSDEEEVHSMEIIRMYKDSQEFGFNKGDEFPVMRNIMGECVIIMGEDKPNIVWSEKEALRYGVLTSAKWQDE